MDQEAFHALDRQVMRLVFDVHNEFGRLLDEELYKREIVERCLAAGLAPAEREVRIRVSHGNFIKDYSMDLLVCRGYMLEAKVADALVSAHRGQAVNYLLLSGLKHGRLVNFRTERVEHEFVSTTLTLEERQRTIVSDQGWLAVNEQSNLLKSMTLELVRDWGAFLEVSLYREAIVHLMGGPAAISRSVEIFSGLRCVGSQTLNLLDNETAFAVTALTHGAQAMGRNLQRLLDHTRLKYLQWINLNHHSLEFTTLLAHRGGPIPT